MVDGKGCGSWCGAIAFRREFYLLYCEIETSLEKGMLSSKAISAAHQQQHKPFRYTATF
jgi:hypothetical protein